MKNNKKGKIVNVPNQLQENSNWVNFNSEWDDQKQKFGNKRPIQTATGGYAKVNDPATWGEFSPAVERCDTGKSNGIGYALTEDDNLVFIDLDKCFDGAGPKPFAQHLVEIFQSFTERSVSGNGLHILCRGSTRLNGNETLVYEGVEHEIEIYTKGRFMLMTGDLIDESLSDIVDGTEALVKLEDMIKKPVVTLKTGQRGSSLTPDQEIQKLASALQHIDPDHYTTWMEVGMAVKLWGCGSECGDLAWETFDQWSSGTKSGNYDPATNRASWDSWAGTGVAGQQVTLGTVYMKAKENGWKFDGRKLSSAQNGQSGGRPSAPPHADTAQRFFDDELVELESGHPTVIQRDGAWHEYSSSGWEIIPEKRIISRITTFMQDQPDLHPHCSSNYFRSVKDNLMSNNYCGTTIPMPSWLDTGENADNWMGFSDGRAVNMLEMAKAHAGLAEKDESRYVRPLCPAFFSKSFVDYPITVGEVETPLFKAYLDRIQPKKENQRMLQQLAGLALTDETRYESCFALVGSGANGKTVFLDILSAMIGRQNVSSVDLQMLDQRFQTFPLATSKLNICGEMPTDVGVSSLRNVEGILKNCISGGEIEVERKGLDKALAKCRARFVFATNSMPTFVDKSDGIWRRLRVIDFPVTIPADERDVHLADRIIQDELSGVLHWAIVGLVDILQNGAVYESEHSKQLKAKHKLDSDKERQFLSECCEPRGEAFVSKGDLYGNYAEWCRRNGYRLPLSKNKFLARVQEIYPELRTNQRSYDETKKRVRCFDGLALIEDLLEENAVKFGRI